MWLNWLPWKYVVRRFARDHGFIDPISLLSRLHGFAQPSEVAAPIELLRAGVVFHARGLMNTKAIQQNLDWVWPYWVQRQFDPRDVAFLPRAFSMTHVNLTLRNWTAIGTPGSNAYPLVDPRGLVTPYYDGWSLDAWILPDDGKPLLPSRHPGTVQRLVMEDDDLRIRTESRKDGLSLLCEAGSYRQEDDAVCRIEYRAESNRPAWLAISLRPANPEGVSFIHTAKLCEDRRTWSLGRHKTIHFSDPAERHVLSDYHNGDVYLGIPEREEATEITCNVGMVTAAALYRLAPNQPRTLRVEVPLSGDTESTPNFRPGACIETWSDALKDAAKLRVPDDRFQFLYEAALRTLVLHAPRDAYPGPYTYRRFWFRDAVYILNALLAAGIVRRAETVFDTFPARQNLVGFFKSQEGEWDSNGEVLWLLRRFTELTGRAITPEWHRAAVRAGEWILFKRLPDSTKGLHAGLMPAGFSAEHLGNNDYYYWDDFWSIAGLDSAAEVCRLAGDEKMENHFREGAATFRAAVERSLKDSAQIRRHPGLPASPYRRMDAGAIGSIVADYPLQLYPPADPRLMATVQFLMDRCFVEGAFFQDMIHSGFNAYLTLQVAQVLLRAGDCRAYDLMQTVAGLASPTGQWPEAIHPATRGGCMGDGQHVWAAAEWVLMVRSMFVREEGDRLILASGIPQEWLNTDEPMEFGPTPTPYGPITVTVDPRAPEPITWKAEWRTDAPQIEVRIPVRCPSSLPTQTRR
ncbi:MAG: hypothetical protein RBU21_13810 [FCB group bacterium]|jgi:hypothetical protein|nr:hypothetical protein [FCB group bacterium]